ncbi:hypothetical protein HZZ08_08605 [Serratia marcescens]|nr:hypothetical protein HZZ08_08605 [Serratia marcescens]
MTFDRQLSGFFSHGIAGAFDGAGCRLRIRLAGKRDIGAFGGEIDRCRLHAGNRRQGPLDATDAGGAGHAFNRQTQTHGRRLGEVGIG